MKRLFQLGTLLLFSTLGLNATSFNATAQTVSTIVSSSPHLGDGLIVASDGMIYASSGYQNSVAMQIDPGGDTAIVATGLAGPVGIFTDTGADLYVPTYVGGKLLKIGQGGVITELATGLKGPAGISRGPDGNFYVSEYGVNVTPGGARVTKVTPGGTQSTYIEGNGLFDPIGIAHDDAGNLYVANYQSGRIYKNDGTTTELFAQIPGSRINQMCFSNGYLYVPSPNLRKIFRVDMLGTVDVLAGTGASGLADGPAGEATFQRPNSAAVSPDGSKLYILDAQVGALRVIDLSSPTSSTDVPELPDAVRLGQNYPNPFSGSTTIAYSLATAGPVQLRLFTLLGEEIETISSGLQAAGEHLVSFSRAGLTAGTYFYRLDVGSSSVTRQMMFLP